ncbi:MAG: hypothetical protein ABI903_16470 [Actinomycetota bacterium]
MTATMQDINGKTYTERPLVQCQPWCSEGDGHPNKWFTGDQWCHSEERAVSLRTEPKIDMGNGEEMRSHVDVLLASEHDEPTHVDVVLDNIDGLRGGFSMTLDEAHDHALHLLMAVAQARGKL